MIRIPIHGKDHIETSLLKPQREPAGSGVKIDGDQSVHACVGRRLLHNPRMGHESHFGATGMHLARPWATALTCNE